jgi:hypothetical protein
VEESIDIKLEDEEITEDTKKEKEIVPLVKVE